MADNTENLDRLAVVEAHNALELLLEWDKSRDFIVPYRVRDPIHAAMRKVREALDAAPGVAPPSAPQPVDVAEAMARYLRRCKSGGLTNKQADLISGAVEDAQRLGYFDPPTFGVTAPLQADIPADASPAVQKAIQRFNNVLAGAATMRQVQDEESDLTKKRAVAGLAAPDFFDGWRAAERFHRIGAHGVDSVDGGHG